MARILEAFGLFAVAAILAAPTFASLYQPEEPMAVPVRPDGVGEPLPFEEFRQRMVTLANIGDPRPTTEGKPNRDRAKVLARVVAFQLNRKPTPDDLAIHCVDLLRLGNTDPRAGDPGLYVNKAVDLLAPRTRDRVPNYFVHTTLAEVHAARGEFREAIEYHEAALIDCEMPATVKGWTEPQRNWNKRLDNDYLPHYLRIRKAEMEVSARKSPETEEPTPLFPLPVKNEPSEPVRFVNDSGLFEVGTLAKVEREKLPPDAVAIVQQLLLWFPTDTRLYWLLAELYAADGKIGEAQVIFEQCTWSRQYGNRKVLMEHRTAVSAAIEVRRLAAEQAAEVRRLAEEQAAIDAYPVSLKAIWVYFGAVVVIAGFAILRALSKRGTRLWPNCCR